MSAILATAAVLYVLQMTTPSGDVRDLSRHTVVSSCVAEKGARLRANRNLQLDCVPIREQVQPAPRNYPTHPGYVRPIPTQPQQGYVQPYRGVPQYRHNNSLEISPYYSGAPIQIRPHEQTQRWYQSWEGGRIGCITPRQCM